MGKQYGVLVSGLSTSTTLDAVNALFQGYGRVRSVFKSAGTQEGSCWTAIVLLAESAAQSRAIENIDGSNFEGCTIGVRRIVKKFIVLFLWLCP